MGITTHGLTCGSSTPRLNLINRDDGKEKPFRINYDSADDLAGKDPAEFSKSLNCIWAPPTPPEYLPRQP